MNPKDSIAGGGRMGYNMRAIIGNEHVLQRIHTAYVSAIIVLLNQGIRMIPLAERLYDDFVNFEDSPEVGQFIFLNEKLSDYLKEVSLAGGIAYIQADYFGGSGKQGAFVWKNGQEVLFQDFRFFFDCQKNSKSSGKSSII